MIFKMARRNLWRHKRRTLITVSSVAFGLWLAVTFSAMGEHTYTSTIDTGAKMGMGHVTVLPKGYLLKPSLDKTIKGASAVMEKANALPGVKGAFTRISGQAMFAAGGRSQAGAFIAIDPARETRETNIFIDRLVEGTTLTSADGRGIIIGKKLAKKLKVQPGKKVVWTTTDKDGEIVSEVARVKGIFETGLGGLDGGFAILPLKKVGTTLGYEEDQASMVVVHMADQRGAYAVRDALKASIGTPERDVLAWDESMVEVVSYVKLDRAFNYGFQFIIGILIAAGIFNTIFMSVLERAREFGVMMAIGMSPAKLFGMVVMESISIGVFGLLLGALVTVPWSFYLYFVGIDLTAMIGEGNNVGGVLLDPIMRFNLTPEVIVGVLGSLFLLTTVAGLYPAYKAGRVPPVESLRIV